jgi:ABC-type oligopeptide transport system substrate-binding subunit/class 3 adenylate cyclase/ribosomal protein L40E
MRCPQCHADNPDQASVCLQCGSALALTCPQCGTELPPQANFCFHCGSPVTAPPAKADVDTVALLPRAVQRLIPREYAERLLATRGRVGKERRTVTILFSDVKGSTALAEGLDPEEVMEIMDGAFDVLIPPIYRYEGTLARLMGDAVLAFFGAPIAHEDDPERACRAALEITAQAAKYAQQLQDERGLAGFNVRVGIHTGLVVMGEVGTDLRVEYTAMGEAVNLAQRLQSAAQPGHVLISADTQRLIAPLFETEALGEMALRGRAQPVAVYRVVAAREVPRKPRGIAGLDSPLVGREAEMAALQQAIEHLQDGQGGVVTIVGEAGIGKSRLVAEARKGLLPPHCHPEGTEGSSSSEEEKILRFAESEKKIPFGLAQGRLRFAQNDKGGGVQWVEGRCLSYSGSVAYQLWTDVLRHLLDIPSDASTDQADRVLRQRVRALLPQRFDEVYPYLARILALPLDDDIENRLAECTGEQVRAATFEAVQTLIECTARHAPLVLVCEDIYWSDPTSMELLEQLLPLTDRLPLLLIAVFRPRREHPSWRVREVAARDHGQRHTDLWLRPLSQGHSGQLMSNLLAMPAVPETLQQRILERAEGNPFYVEEIVRALIAKGAIAQDAGSGQWQIAAEVSAIAIPDTLNGVLTARIDGLPQETRRVLRTAAVIGRIFSYRVLADVARLDGSLEPHLIALQEAELIRERARQPEREYIFKHELTREAAYNGLLKKERRTLHRQVAEALERLFAERIGEQLGLLAHHWERAGDADKAIDYSLRAGDRARLAFAQQEAIAHFQRALALAQEHGKQPQAARAWMKLGLTHQEAFDFPQARRAYDQGFALWQRATRSTPATPAPPAPHALRMDWFCAPLSFDPAVMAAMYSLAIAHQIYSSLVRLTPEFDLVPEVAYRWEVLDRGRRYVFHLRDDWLWSDGTPVSASDFEYAWKRMANPATGATFPALTYIIKGARAFHQGQVTDPSLVGVRATDRCTLEVHLEHPVPYFLHIVAVALWPVPRHVVEAHGSAWAEVENLVTNGPFVVESWKARHSLALARNPRYAGHFGGNLQRVRLHLFDDPARLLQIYEDDELDVFFPEHLGRAEMNRARSRHPTEDLWLQRANTKYLGFDVTRPPFDDPRVRHALALGIDRAALSGAGSCAYFPATGGLVPPGTPGHQPGLAHLFDPETARRLLAEAGYPGGRRFPDVTLLYVRGFEYLCIDLQAQWRENLGIEVRWEAPEWAAFLQRMRAGTERPHMFALGSVSFVPDPAAHLAYGSFRQWTGWSHEEYNRLVGEAQGLTNPARRMQLFAQAERILIEEVPIVPLMHGLNLALVKPWVTRFPVSVLKWLFLKDVILEPH